MLGGRATIRPPPAAARADLADAPGPVPVTSAAFYDGGLGGVGGLGGQEVQGWGWGLCLVEVPHQGNTDASPEEAREVARLAGQLTGRRWRTIMGPNGPWNPPTS